MISRKLNPILAAIISLGLVACSGGGGGGDDAPPPPPPPEEPTLPDTYNFSNEDGADTVSFTGQVARQMLISDLVDFMNSLTRDAGNVPADVVEDLNYYFDLDPDVRDPGYTPVFDLSGGGDLKGNDTDAATTTLAPGQVSGGKKLSDKLAGQDKPEHILGGEFFGWDGASSPLELVNTYFGLLGAEAANTSDSIAVAGGTANIGAATVTPSGLDLRQLIQKFLLGAVTLSQGTADYLSIDFGSDANLTLASGKTYTEGAHDFDEAFGYFGAARDYNDYTNDEIADTGYKDTVVVDGVIDVRSEFNFGNSTNCAKRDRGTAGNSQPTNYTGEAFDAFIAGRAILQTASEGATESQPGNLTAEQASALEEQIVIAAQTWEKCVAATVVHYINDVTDDMGDFVGDTFADLDNFLSLAKHWGEMKGFALGLQFSPYSPFRSGQVDGNAVAVDVDDLKQVLSLMGDAPVLADGTQNGSLYNGAASSADAKAAYLQALQDARDILQQAYGFDAENVANW